jgi:hypothetical protein
MNVPMEDIPPEIVALRQNLTRRENLIMNCIGVMAYLDGRGDREMAEPIHEALTTLGDMTEAEFERLADLYNQTVEIMQAVLGHVEFALEDLNG